MNSHHARLAAIGLAIAALGLGIVSSALPQGQVSARRIEPGTVHWPPRPENIVNVNTEDGFPNGLPLPAGDSYTLFDVPIDQWLVITSLIRSDQDPTDSYFHVFESIGSTVTRKFGKTANVGNGDPVGVAFRPGSFVILTNTSGSTSVLTYLSFTGYLVDA